MSRGRLVRVRAHGVLKVALRTGVGLLALFATVRGVSFLQAQPLNQDEPPLRLRSDTRLVEVNVSVRDSQGRPVENLKQADFTVTDDGRARPFTIFSFNRGAPGRPPFEPSGPPSGRLPVLAGRSGLPPNVFTNTGGSRQPSAGHSTIILLDGVNGWFDNFDKARKGVLGLLDKVPSDERIAVYVLRKGVGLVTLQDYTTDRSKLAAAVAAVIPSGMPPAPPGTEADEGMMDEDGAPPVSRPAERASILGNDSVEYSGPPEDGFSSDIEREHAMRLAAEDVRMSLDAFSQQLRDLPGRKSIFWVTQGFPPRQIRKVNQSNWDKTFENLNDANVEVNTVDSNGIAGPPRFWGNAAILAMQLVAARTGGNAYFYRNDLDGAMASGIADSRSSYTLGFYLTEIDGEYHKLSVHVDRPGLQLNYRLGYYAQDEAARQNSARKAPIQAALLNPTGSADVGIIASVDIAPGKPRGTLTAHLTLAPESLSIEQTQAGYTGRVETMYVELDANGKTIGRFTCTAQFTFEAPLKTKFDRSGVMLSRPIPLVDGTVKLQIVVRDKASGRVGTIEIPLGQDAPRGARK
jgi:VWFA-related protein